MCPVCSPSIAASTNRIVARAWAVVLTALSLLAVSLPAAENKLTGDAIPTKEGDLVIHPVNHATFVLQWNGKTICVDPVGGPQRFAGLPLPDVVLLTDIHGDHLDNETLIAVRAVEATIIAPEAVAEKLLPGLRSRTTVLANGQSTEVKGIKIEAIPMYNLNKDRLKFHAKGRGNGYVLTLGGKRVYISGDTEDIPEMRALKNIDVAFVCMNLPYTMTVDQAASAVKQFHPGIVYPYHYRGSDVEKFKQLVGATLGIEVRLREWYK